MSCMRMWAYICTYLCHMPGVCVAYILVSHARSLCGIHTCVFVLGKELSHFLLLVCWSAKRCEEIIAARSTYKHSFIHKCLLLRSCVHVTILSPVCHYSVINCFIQSPQHHKYLSSYDNVREDCSSEESR